MTRHSIPGSLLCLTFVFVTIHGCQQSKEEPASKHDAVVEPFQMPGPPIDLPTLPSSAVEDVSKYHHTGKPAVWIGETTIWVGRFGVGDPVEVIPISEATTELIEPLARKLESIRDEIYAVETDEASWSLPLVLLADAGTSTDTLRRVLTTARATGHLRTTFVVGGASLRGVSIASVSPVPHSSGRRRFSVLVDIGTDGVARLGGQPATIAAVKAAGARFGEDVPNVSVRHEPLPYETWLSAVATLVEGTQDRITLAAAAGEDVGVQSSNDVPPPPPASDAEDEAPPPDVPRPEPPKAGEPKPDPVAVRIEYWWKRSERAAAKAEARRP